MTLCHDTVPAEYLALLPRIGYDVAQEGVALCAVLDETVHGFSVEELREIDDYAFTLGIEAVLCACIPPTGICIATAGRK